MNIQTKQSRIHTIYQNDPRFNIVDDLVVAKRAGFEISNNCPNQYKSMIVEAIKNGWLQPIACVHERELLIMGLAQ